MGLVVSLYCLFIDLLFMLYLLIGDFGVGCRFVVLVVLVGAGGVCCLLISLWVGSGVSLLHV